MELYERNNEITTRWISFENQSGAKGQGGTENNKAKGHAFDSLPAGESITLFDVSGSSGIITRMWFTISDRSPEMLRALRLQIFWDGCLSPAVNVPFGDFFCASAGIMRPFENELFSSPEGKSFVCYIPMPFTKSAKIVLTNESSNALSHIFYDINYILKPLSQNEVYYFHACWNRENKTKLCKDFAIMPQVSGAGHFLGCSVGVTVNPNYPGSWWGEGEVKIYLDGDSDYPTLIGSGTEDYIGTAWGQGEFCNRFQGSLVSDSENGKYSFFRFHIKDMVFFNNACRVEIQQIGGTSKANLALIQSEKNPPFKIVSADHKGHFIKLYEINPDITLDDPLIPQESWINFYREDDFSATAYFYLDKPDNLLPPLLPVSERISAIKK